MSENTYEGFISTNSDIADISIGDIQNGMIAIVMFGTLWGLGALCMLKLYTTSHFPKVTPSLTDSAVEHVPTNPTEELSLEAKKKYMLKYIDEILPTIYRSSVEHDSTLQSIWKTIHTYYPYATIFTAEVPGADELRLKLGLYLLTIQAMLMFIMAVFFDLQVCE